MFNLDKILEQWYKTTKREVDSNTIRVGVESDWTCMKAKDFMKTDPSGMLTILALRSAYKEWLRENSFTYEQLINGEWSAIEKDVIDLRSCLYGGEFNAVYDTMLSNILKNLNILENKYTIDDVCGVDRLDKILYTAAENFNKKLNHEQFDVGNKKSNTGIVLPKMFRFEHFKQFIYALRNTSKDNFMCIALIDRTAETCDTEYDERFDSFFCIGIKNNGNIYTVSDRVVLRSPEHTYKTRNPARDFDDKVDFSYFPYYNLDGIKKEFEHNGTLLITDGKTDDERYSEMFNQYFSIEDKIYIAVLLTLAYDKYFIDDTEYTYPLKRFTSEIKFLQSGETDTTALTEYKEVVWLPEKTVDATTYPGNHKVYNHGVFDHLIDVYKDEINSSALITMRDDVVSVDEVQDRAWWLTRKQQKEIIQSCLDKDCGQREREIEQWLIDKMKNNAEHLFNYILNTPKYDDTKRYSMGQSSSDTRPILWEAYKNGEPLYTSSIIETKVSKYNANGYVRNSHYCNTEFGRVKYEVYQYPLIEGILLDDNDNRCYEIELKMRSNTDIERFLNVKNEELPVEIRRHFAPRLDMWSIMGWQPYSGNSILDLTDPMNEIRNPYYNIMPKVRLIVSKSMLNKMVKKQKENNNEQKTMEKA